MRLYNAASCTPVATPSSLPRSYNNKPVMKKPGGLESFGGHKGEFRQPRQSPHSKAASSVFCPFLSQNSTASTSGSSGTLEFDMQRRSSDSFHFDISVVKRSNHVSRRQHQIDLQDDISRTTSSTLSTRISLDKILSESVGNSKSSRRRYSFPDAKDWTEENFLGSSDLPSPSPVLCQKISKEEQSDPFWQDNKAGGKPEVEQRDAQAQEHSRGRVTLFPKMGPESSKVKSRPSTNIGKDNWLDASSSRSWEVFSDRFPKPSPESTNKDAVEPCLKPMPCGDSNQSPKEKDSLRLRMEHAPVRPWKDRQMKVIQDPLYSPRLKKQQQSQDNAYHSYHVPTFLAGVLEERYQRARKNESIERRYTPTKNKMELDPFDDDNNRGLNELTAIDELGFPWGAEDSEAVILMVKSSEDEFCRPVTTFVRKQNGHWAEVERD